MHHTTPYIFGIHWYLIKYNSLSSTLFNFWHLTITFFWRYIAKRHEMISKCDVMQCLVRRKSAGVSPGNDSRKSRNLWCHLARRACAGVWRIDLVKYLKVFLFRSEERRCYPKILVRKLNLGHHSRTGKRTNINTVLSRAGEIRMPHWNGDYQTTQSYTTKCSSVFILESVVNWYLLTIMKDVNIISHFQWEI